MAKFFLSVRRVLTEKVPIEKPFYADILGPECLTGQCINCQICKKEKTLIKLVTSGADEYEHTILSLRHGIFNDWSSFTIPFRLWKKGSSGLDAVTSNSFVWLRMAIPGESHSTEGKFDPKINRSTDENAVTENPTDEQLQHRYIF